MNNTENIFFNNILVTISEIKFFFFFLKKYETPSNCALRLFLLQLWVIFCFERSVEAENPTDYPALCLCPLPACSGRWAAPIWSSRPGREEKHQRWFLQEAPRSSFNPSLPVWAQNLPPCAQRHARRHAHQHARRRCRCSFQLRRTGREGQARGKHQQVVVSSSSSSSRTSRRQWLSLPHKQSITMQNELLVNKHCTRSHTYWFPGWSWVSETPSASVSTAAQCCCHRLFKGWDGLKVPSCAKST